MVGLGTTAQSGLLGFYKVADVHAFANLASRTQVRIGPENRMSSDMCLVNDATRPDLHTVCDLRVADDAVRANAAVGADSSVAQKLDKWLDHRVHSNLHIRINHTGFRPVNGHSVGH